MWIHPHWTELSKLSACFAAINALCEVAHHADLALAPWRATFTGSCPVDVPRHLVDKGHKQEGDVHQVRI